MFIEFGLKLLQTNKTYWGKIIFCISMLLQNRFCFSATS